ncbi:hypothetical protein BJX61DRAFT_201276 [Aspergillus egyptiacus]|nr:hypothetical protein BJX61DRAFT_201276 [Aspergillus egyptiacus]
MRTLCNAFFQLRIDCIVHLMVLSVSISPTITIHLYPNPSIQHNQQRTSPGHPHR